MMVTRKHVNNDSSRSWDPRWATALDGNSFAPNPPASGRIEWLDGSSSVSPFRDCFQRTNHIGQASGGRTSPASDDDPDRKRLGRAGAPHQMAGPWRW